MVGRSKRKIKGPVANQLSGAAEPNVLSIGAEPGTTGTSDWDWTADDSTIGAEADDDFALDEELEGKAGEESDDRAAAQRRADLQAELERQAEEFGLTNDDPTALYGPNGDDVAAVLDALDEMDRRSAVRVAEAWELVDGAEREVVERILRRRHRGGRHEYELSAGEDAVAAWLAARTPADDEEEELWQEVAQAAADAITAIILDEDLSDADYDTLYGPWAAVMDAEGGAATEREAADATEDEPPEPAEPVALAGAPASRGEDSDQEGEFGPNTAAVVEFLGGLDALEDIRTAELVAAWRAQPKDDLKAAHRSLQELADEDAAWKEQLRLAQEEIFAWMDHRTTRYLDRSGGRIDKTRIRESAGPVLADAVAALVLADIFEPEDAEILYAPWAEVVGAPALPTFEDDEVD